MYETEGVWQGDVNGLCEFHFNDDRGAHRVGKWQCPAERMHEFSMMNGVGSKARLGIRDGRIETVTVIPW